MGTGLAEYARKPSDGAVASARIPGAQSPKVHIKAPGLLNRIGAPCPALEHQDCACILVGDVVADVDRDLSIPGALRGEPCFRIGENLVAPTARTDHNRIEGAVRVDDSLQRGRNVRQRASGVVRN